MEWFYVKGGEQQGPVDEAALADLHAKGVITAGTLVWKEGMGDWVSYREAGLGAVKPPLPGEGKSGDAASPASDSAECAYSGERRPKSEMVAYGDQFVSPEHKDAFLQRLREGDPGVIPGELVPDDYSVETGLCLSRAWQLFTGNFWPIVGITLLINIINGVAQQIYVGSLVLFVPLMSGLQYYFLLQIRGGTATIEDAFSGFKRNFGQLALVNLVGAFIMIGAMIPGIVVLVAGGVMTESVEGGTEEVGAVLAAGGMFLMLLPMMYLMLAWVFAGMLCIDKMVPFWPAMKISMKTVHKHLFGCALFMLVIYLLNVAGVIALCVGMLVTSPWALIALTYLYEDIYGRERRGRIL